MTDNRTKSVDHWLRLVFNKKPHKPILKPQTGRGTGTAFAKLDGNFLNRLSKRADHLTHEKKPPPKGSALGNPRIICVFRRLKNANENHPVGAASPPSASRVRAR